MSEERWAPVVGWETAYEVSDTGLVRAVRTGKMLRPYRRALGYLAVTLWQGGRPKCSLVHRLVAEAFVPNTEGKPQVNHLDRDTGNNRATNLEWATARENVLHSMPHRKNLVRGVVVDPSGQKHEVHNLRAFCRERGLDRENMRKMMLGRYKSSKGWTLP